MSLSTVAEFLLNRPTSKVETREGKRRCRKCKSWRDENDFYLVFDGRTGNRYRARMCCHCRSKQVVARRGKREKKAKQSRKQILMFRRNLDHLTRKTI